MLVSKCLPGPRKLKVQKCAARILFTNRKCLVLRYRTWRPSVSGSGKAGSRAEPMRSGSGSGSTFLCPVSCLLLVNKSNPKEINKINKII